MPLSTQKLNPSVKEFEKGLLKFGLVALFFVFGLFGVFSDVLAWEDSFEDYGLGTDLDGQGGWGVDAPDRVLIQNTKVKTGEKGIYTNYRSSVYGWFHGTSTEPIGEGSASFWVKSVFGAGNNNWFSLTIGTGISAEKTAEIKFTKNEHKVYYLIGATPYYLGEYFSDVWANMKMEWVSETKLIRYNYNDLGWTDWVNNRSNTSVSPFKIRPYFMWSSLDNIWYLDDFSMEGTCSLEYCDKCGSVSTCRNVGCCWYWSWWGWPLEDGCTDCPVGECDSGWQDCQNCLIQETCEAEESCYWFNGLCKFGLGVCGEGFDCEFCESQETCEAKNCHWFNDFCWQFEPPEVSSWADYYSEYGDYPTSSAFINQMASTTGIFFGSIGSFLTGFVEAFDTSEAQAQGIAFGSAVPRMRGYLAIINDFFGELPVAQAFLFTITFIMAVGLFRLIRELIEMFKRPV